MRREDGNGIKLNDDPLNSCMPAVCQYSIVSTISWPLNIIRFREVGKPRFETGTFFRLLCSTSQSMRGIDVCFSLSGKLLGANELCMFCGVSPQKESAGDTNNWQWWWVLM